MSCEEGWVFPALRKAEPLWWVDFGWLPDAHPATLLLPSAAGQEGENKMKTLVG